METLQLLETYFQMSGCIVVQMHISFNDLAAASAVFMRFNAHCRNNKMKLIYFKRKIYHS